VSYVRNVLEGQNLSKLTRILMLLLKNAVSTARNDDENRKNRNTGRTVEIPDDVKRVLLLRLT